MSPVIHTLKTGGYSARTGMYPHPVLVSLCRIDARAGRHEEIGWRGVEKDVNRLSFRSRGTCTWV